MKVHFWKSGILSVRLTHCMTLPSMRKNAWLSSVSLCHHVSVRVCTYSSISAPVSAFTLSGEMHPHKVLCTILGCSRHPRPMKDPASKLGSHILFKEFEFSHLHGVSLCHQGKGFSLGLSFFLPVGKGKEGAQRAFFISVPPVEDVAEE